MESDKSGDYYGPHGTDSHIKFTSQIDEAAAKGDASRIRALFAQCEREGSLRHNWHNSILLASKSGCRDAVQALVDCGVSVDDVNKYSWTPLLDAAREGHLDAVRILLAAGANINARDRRGGGALDLAAFRGHLLVVQALLAAGCDVNSRRNISGATALHIAASNGDIAIMEALVAAGADCAALDRERRSPLAWTVSYDQPKALLKLLELGAPVEAPGLPPLPLAMLSS
ncbi:hypothetical protein N2152v2_000676 [Parachlorella kessleri]